MKLRKQAHLLWLFPALNVPACFFILVSLFSCLALLLGLLSSTAMASVHTANALQSAQISSMTLTDDRRRGNFEHEGIFDPPSHSPTNSREDYKRWLAESHSLFPDLHITVED